MTNSQRLSAVRQKLQAWFLDQLPTDPWRVRESILIREGFYCGRRFDFGGYRAVWFVEEDQIKIYQQDGQLVTAFQASEAWQAVEAAEPTILQPRFGSPPVRRAA